MLKIFIGLILVFIDFNLSLDQVTIGLFPDFIGYIIMINGIVELAGKSYRFIKVKPYATGMAVYTAILYVIDLFGISYTVDRWIYFLLGIISSVVSLFILYNIVMGIKDIEVNDDFYLNADQLYIYWKWMAVFTAISYVLLVIPVLAVISLIIEFIAAISFLIAFNKTKNLYISNSF